MWIPLETDQGRGLFLVKLQTPSKRRYTKVYHVLNSCFFFFFFLSIFMNYGGPKGGIMNFFWLFPLSNSALSTTESLQWYQS